MLLFLFDGDWHARAGTGRHCMSWIFLTGLFVMIAEARAYNVAEGDKR